MTHRILRMGLTALSIGLGAIVVVEVSAGALGSAALPQLESRDPIVPEIPIPSDIDSLVAEILERPLFAASRVPFEDAIIADEDSDEGEEVSQALQARLTGVAILPEGREALFEREGGKPVAVKEGGQIEGWTVKAIRTNQVVLSSAAGDEVLEPANAQGPIRRPRVAANGAGAQLQQKGAPTVRAPQAARAGKQDHK
jgi:hypothetical protein